MCSVSRSCSCRGLNGEAGGGAKGEKGRLERLEKMVLFCEASVECRRRLLLQAFGEDLRTEDDGPECGREDAKLGGEDDGESSFMALSERAQQESRQMLKGTVCARSCDNCWKKTHLAVQVRMYLHFPAAISLHAFLCEDGVMRADLPTLQE